MILQKYPVALSCKDKSGFTPLICHIHNSARISLKIVKFLVHTNLESTRIIDEYNWTPLHHAVHRLANWDIIEYLIITYPEGLLQKSMFGNQKPCDLYLSKISEDNYIVLYE